THTYEPRSFEEAFGITTGRYSYYRNRLNLAYTKDIAKQFSIGARYANEIDEISREDLSDSSLNRVGLDAAYFPASSTQLLFSYDFSRRDFTPGSDAATHTITSGLRYYLTKQLYFDGKAGIDFMASYNDKEYTRPLFFASLTNDLDENTTANLSFAKQYYTNAYSQDLFDYWQVSGALTRRLLERLSCSLSGFYGNGEYITTVITDKLLGSTIGFTYDIKDNWKASLSYSFSKVKSTVRSREYKKNMASSAITATF
ncbi:MAG: outer membrane beta-barrel protein, partial [Candidatus Omnitrophota bacterium]